MDKTLCVIPARGGSKRLARKNVALLRGKPLLAYTIGAALQSRVFDVVCVSTEDEDIATVAKTYGAEVPFKRPTDLARDDVGVVQVCLHALDHFEAAGERFETLGVLLPTAPLRTGQDIQAAFREFSTANANFLMAVTDYVYSPFQALGMQDGFLKPFWGPDYCFASRQKLPKVVVDNGSIYLMDVEAFRQEEIFYGQRLVGFHMPQERSIDVDNAFSLKLAEFFLQQQTQSRSEV